MVAYKTIMGQCEQGLRIINLSGHAEFSYETEALLQKATAEFYKTKRV